MGRNAPFRQDGHLGSLRPISWPPQPPLGHKSPSRPAKALLLAGCWGGCCCTEETIAAIGTLACCAGAELREKLRRLLLRLPRSLQVEPTAAGAEDKALVVGREGGPEEMDGVACIN